MLISRVVKGGPDGAGGWKMPYRTMGYYGHLPKFWNCKNYSDNMASHAKCKVGWHLSDVGYVNLVGKKYIWKFFYMGNPYRHKLFERWPKKLPEVRITP